MKAKLAIILAALLIAASMTSCGNGKKNDETTQSNKIDINTEAPANGSESENTTEAPNETTQPNDGSADPDEIKDPGEYTYTALEQAEKIQILSATGAATLRAADYAVLTSVPNGTQLDRVGISNGANGFWSQVVYNGEICYVASHLVTTILDLDDGFVDVNKTLIKNDGSLKIRVAPDLNSEVIGYISAGQEIVVIAENATTGWYKISFVPYGATEATVGYVASNPEYYEPEINISVPNGYAAYIDENIAFVYPENWTSITEGDYMKSDPQTGDNYVIVYEPYTVDHDIYFTLTNELFAEMFIPAYENMGYTISDYSVNHDLRGDTKIAIISFSNHISSGSTMYQTQYIFVTSSNLVCTLTVTSTSPESSIATDIYNSLIITE